MKSTRKKKARKKIMKRPKKSSVPEVDNFELQTMKYQKLQSIRETVLQRLKMLHEFSDKVVRIISNDRHRNDNTSKNIVDNSTVAHSILQFKEHQFFSNDEYDSVVSSLRNTRIFIIGRKNGKSTLLNLLGLDFSQPSSNPWTSYHFGKEHFRAKRRCLPRKMCLEDCKKNRVCTSMCSQSYPNSRILDPVQEHVKLYECINCEYIMVCEYCADRCHQDHDLILKENADEVVVCDCFLHKSATRCQFCRFENMKFHEYIVGKLDTYASQTDLNIESIELYLNRDILRIAEFVVTPNVEELDDQFTETFFKRSNDSAIFVYDDSEEDGSEKEWNDFVDRYREIIEKYKHRIIVVATTPQEKKKTGKLFENSCCEFYFINDASESSSLVNKTDFVGLKKKIHGMVMQTSFDTLHQALLRYEQQACALKDFFSQVRDITNMAHEEKRLYFASEEEKIEKLEEENHVLDTKYSKEKKTWVKKIKDAVSDFWSSRETKDILSQFAMESIDEKNGDGIVDFALEEFSHGSNNRYDNFLFRVNNLFRKFIRTYITNNCVEIFDFFDSKPEEFSFSEQLKANKVCIYNTSPLLHYSVLGAGYLSKLVEEKKKIGLGDLGLALALPFPVAFGGLAGGFFELGKAKFRKKNRVESTRDMVVNTYLKKQKRSKSVRNQTEIIISEFDKLWRSQMNRKRETVLLKRWFCEFLKECNNHYNFKSTFSKLFTEISEYIDEFYASAVQQFLLERFPLDLSRVDEKEIIYMKGHFVEVVKCTYDEPEVGNEYFCLKKVAIDHQTTLVDIIREAFLSASLHHPCLLRLRGFQISRFGGNILTKYYTDNLNSVLMKFDVSEFTLDNRVFVISKLLDGIHHLHKNRIIHRDIKPGNITLDYSRKRNTEGLHIHSVVVIDFGHSKLHDDVTCTITGTPTYYAPEVLQNLFQMEVLRKDKSRLRRRVTAKVDVHSVGIVILEILGGLKVTNEIVMEEDTVRGILSWAGEDMAGKLARMIKRCVDADPKKRPGIAEVREEWGVLKLELIGFEERFCKIGRRFRSLGSRLYIM